MHVIREARIEDAEAIARVHVAAWRAGYRGMMPDAFLDSLDEKLRAARWRGVLEKRDAGKKIFVAIEDGELVGFAGVGPARDEAGAWGKGIASALLAEATRALASLGHREAILWVLRQNSRARGFYEREGWNRNGDRRDTISENGFTFEVDELRYTRALA